MLDGTATSQRRIRSPPIAAIGTPAMTTLAIVERIFAFYESTGQPGERLGETLQRVGMQALRAAVLA